MSSQSQREMRGNYVFVRADALRLLLPQEQVGAAEYLQARNGEERVLAALSSRMTLLPECPEERFIVTTLGGEGGIGWCWNELQVLIGVELQPQPLPAALVAPGTPVDCYVEHEGELAYLCDAGRLQQFALAERS